MVSEETLGLMVELVRLRRAAYEVIKYHQSQKRSHLATAIDDLRKVLEESKDQ